MNVEKQINELDNRMTHVESQFDEMNQTLRRIENAMLGDKQYGIAGIPHKVSKNSKDISKLEDFKKKVTYYALGGSAVGTFLGWVVVNFVINSI